MTLVGKSDMYKLKSIGDSFELYGTTALIGLVSE